MAFTIQEFHDLIQVLEQHPEWRTELRRLILTDELLSLPEQLVRLQAETERGFQQLADAQRRTEEQVAEFARALQALTGEVSDLKQSQQTLLDDVGGFKGILLESWRGKPSRPKPPT